MKHGAKWNTNFIFCWNELLTCFCWKITGVFLFAPDDFAFHTAPFTPTYLLAKLYWADFVWEVPLGLKISKLLLRSSFSRPQITIQMCHLIGSTFEFVEKKLSFPHSGTEFVCEVPLGPKICKFWVLVLFKIQNCWS
jgi:hypothetical protein